MELEVPVLSVQERYKLLVGLVFPRPIALISTRSENGIANCAPFSYFNAVCEDPMLVVLSFNRRSDGRMKHSLANLLRTGEFVVNLVDENIANGMHVSSGEFADDVSEFDQASFRERGYRPRKARSFHHGYPTCMARRSTLLGHGAAHYPQSADYVGNVSVRRSVYLVNAFLWRSVDPFTVRLLSTRKSDRPKKRRAARPAFCSCRTVSHVVQAKSED